MHVQGKAEKGSADQNQSGQDKEEAEATAEWKERVLFSLVLPCPCQLFEKTPGSSFTIL